MGSSKYAAYFSLAKKMRSQGMPLERAELISQFTEGKKSSLKDLTDWEYKEFIKWLNTLIQNHRSSNDWQNSPENKMRRKIIALFYKMGYRVTVVGHQMPSKADMAKINQWVLKFGYLHKPLNDYTVEELPQLVSQVETIHKKHIEKYG